MSVKLRLASMGRKLVEYLERKQAEESEAAPLSRSSEAALTAFVRRLENTGRDGGAIVVGRVHFIGIEKLRERLGPRWPHYADRVDSIVRSVTHRRLATTDLFFPLDDLGYVIIFGQCSEEEGALRCAVLADEIMRRLLGDGDSDTEGLEIRTLVRSIDGGLEFRSAERWRALSELLARDQPDGSEADGDRPDEVDASSGFEVPDFLAQTGFQFLPLWDVRQERISTYVLSACRRTEDGTLVDSLAGLPFAASGSAIGALDQAAVAHAAEAIRDGLRSQTPFLVAVRVHVGTLSTGTTRDRLLGDLRLLEQAVRDRLLLLLVLDSAGIPQSRLAELHVALRPFARAVLALVSPDETRIAAFREAGMFCVGLDAVSSGGPSPSALRRIERLATEADRCRIRSFIAGADHLCLATCAVAAGVDFIVGDALAAPLDAPAGLIHYRITDLLRRSLASAGVELDRG